jgi:hypothetical protein
MRPSSIDELPEEIRAEIGRLRTQGATIDRIVEHLRGLVGSALDEAPSRSAIGRHVKKMAFIGEKLRRSREVAEALVRELGDQPASKAAQLNIELLHGAVFDLFNRADPASGDLELVDGDGRAALAGNPEGIMMLAKSLDHLTRASKSDVEFVAKVEARAAEKAKREAVAAVEAISKAEGISGKTMAAIKAGIFGVRA